MCFAERCATRYPASDGVVRCGRAERTGNMEKLKPNTSEKTEDARDDATKASRRGNATCYTPARTEAHFLMSSDLHPPTTVAGPLSLEESVLPVRTIGKAGRCCFAVSSHSENLLLSPFHSPDRKTLKPPSNASVCVCVWSHRNLSQK